VTSGSRP